MPAGSSSRPGRPTMATAPIDRTPLPAVDRGALTENSVDVHAELRVALDTRRRRLRPDAAGGVVATLAVRGSAEDLVAGSERRQYSAKDAGSFPLDDLPAT